MKKKISEAGRNLLLLLAGSVIFAFSIKALLVPNEFIARGLTGISLLIFYKIQVVPLWALYLLLNIPVFLLGFKFVGLRFTLYSLAGMGMYTLILGVVPFVVLIQDKMLCALAAGAISGVGLAIIMRSYGTCGGADILYVIINKLAGVPIGTSAFVINAVIVLVMAFLFPIENVLYTVVYLAISMVVTNKVFHGMANRQTVFIMSDKWQQIAAVMGKSRMGVTAIEGKGGYKGQSKVILYSVVKKRNMQFLKNKVLTIDNEAFMTVLTAEDVTGLDIGNQPHW